MATIACDASPIVSAAARPSTAKRAFIHRLFTAIAPRYDGFNRIVTFRMDRRWRRRAVELGGVCEGMRVLDVCAGTGEMSMLCAQRVGGNGLVVGLDFAQAMLRVAARKSRDAAWLQGDALRLPFAAERFDRVTIGFSTRNLSHLGEGVAEMLRVLKPGGRLLILETGRPSQPLLRAGYFCFLCTAAPLIGVLLTGRVWPFTYLARSVKRFLAPAQVLALLESRGATARHIPLSLGLASLYMATKG